MKSTKSKREPQRYFNIFMMKQTKAWDRVNYRLLKKLLDLNEVKL
jgi:hypothetical protein